jgi:hypothetical protein
MAKVLSILTLLSLSGSTEGLFQHRKKVLTEEEKEEARS